MNFNDMSVAELRELQDKIQQEIKTKEQQEFATARQQILEIAQSAGISLDELMSQKSHGKIVGVKEKVAVCYRHPADALLQWTGRGRQPKWVQNWIAAGKSLDDVRV